MGEEASVDQTAGASPAGAIRAGEIAVWAGEIAVWAGEIAVRAGGGGEAKLVRHARGLGGACRAAAGRICRGEDTGDGGCRRGGGDGRGGDALGEVEVADGRREAGTARSWRRVARGARLHAVTRLAGQVCRRAGVYGVLLEQLEPQNQALRRVGKRVDLEAIRDDWVCGPLLNLEEGAALGHALCG